MTATTPPRIACYNWQEGAAGSENGLFLSRGSIFHFVAAPAAMDLDQLHTFLEIVRLKSFSKAAETCFRTQPAISAQVRQLEQELNNQLFHRFGSRITLTTAGKIFCHFAEQILELRRQAQDAINELEQMPRGELIIAAKRSHLSFTSCPRCFPSTSAASQTFNCWLSVRMAPKSRRQFWITWSISALRSCRSTTGSSR